MKKLVIILMAAATVFALTGLLFLFAAKEKNASTPVATPATPQPTVASTTTPTAQPTTQPTPTVKAMTPEEFFNEAQKNGSPYHKNGTVVVISGVVDSKMDNSPGFKFLVPYNDQIQGKRVFTVYVYLVDKKDLSRVKVGEAITINGTIETYEFNVMALIDGTVN